jgi:hypothetical protein
VQPSTTPNTSTSPSQSDDSKIDNGGSEESSSSVSTTSTTTASGNTPSGYLSGSVSTVAMAPVVDNEVMTVQLVGKSGTFNPQVAKEFYGEYKLIAAHLGNGVGITVDASQITGDEEEVNLGYTMVKVPEFAAGFQTYHLAPYEASKISYYVDVHMNLGKEYENKIAYVFILDLETKAYVLKGAMPVNEIGNVALHTDEISDIMVLIAE